MHKPRLGLVLAMAMITSMVSAAEQKITLNFVNADITTIIEAVSKQTGKNFIVDPRVKAKVTIISQKPMNSADIYQVFMSVLKVHGFAAVPGRGVIKIIPEADAKQDAIDTVSNRHPGIGDEIVTRVIEVKYVDAAQLVPILRPLVPQRGHLAAYPASNILLISDSADNVSRLVSIIERIDQATGDDVEVMPLRHAIASDIVRIVTQLDTPEPGKPKSDNKLIADDRTNSILLGGDKSSRLRLRALILHLDTPMDIGGDTHVVYLRNAVAKDLVPVLTGVSQSVGGTKGAAAAATPGSKMTIQADENTNSLVINAPPDVFRSLRGVIQKLDIRRAQVLVEAVIAEVSQNASRELGIQWAADGSSTKNPVGIVNFTAGGSITGLLASPPSIADGLNLAIGDLTGANKIGALVRALSADAGTNILSTPSLVTMDNHEAEIVVGQNVPFITGQYSSTGGSGSSTVANPFNTVQRQDVGLSLKIKPQINEGDTVKLDVAQEVSSIATSSVGVDLITNKRSIKTSVMVEDGQVLVLGGLIEDNLSEVEQRVPGLGDIPILGWLFRYKKTTKVKTNLMVFLNPTILKDPALVAKYTDDKYTFMRKHQIAMRERGLTMMSNSEVPVMPEIPNFINLPPPYTEGKGNAGGALAVPPQQEDVR